MMKIELHTSYRNLHGVTLVAGEYNSDEIGGSLCGYLVATGHATRIDEVESDGIESTNDYSDLTKDELTAMLFDIGIDAESITGTGANGNVLKSDLVAALEVWHDSTDDTD